MPKYAMIYDAQKCIGCQSCTIACKSENNVPEGFFRLQVKIKGPFGLSPNLHFKFERHSCEMCENTPCVSVCPTKASFMDENGIVDIDKDKCVGCLYCVAACPYGARYVNPQTKTPDKCNFCKHTHLKIAGEPACVSVCPTDALVFGDLSANDDAIHQILAQKPYFTRKANLGTKPKLFVLPEKKGGINYE